MSNLQIPFRCGVENGTRGGWCFADSICMIDTENDVEYCIDCAEGYMHDRLWGHFDNCGLPMWFLPTFIGFSTFCFFTGTAIILYRWRTLSKSMMPLVKSYLILTLVEWLENMSLFLEGGRFTIATLLLGARSVAAPIFFLQFMVLMLKWNPRPGEQYRVDYLFGFTAIPILTLVCLCLAFAVLAFEPNAQVNAIMFSIFCVGGPLFTVLGFACIIQVQRVLSTVSRHPNGSPRLWSAVWRLRNMRNVLLVDSLIGTPAATVYGAVTLLTIGSVPYSWVLTVFLSTFSAAFPAFIYFLSRYGQKKDVFQGHGPEQRMRSRNMSTYNPKTSFKTKSEPTLALDIPPSVNSNISGVTGKTKVVDTPQAEVCRI